VYGKHLLCWLSGGVPLQGEFLPGFEVGELGSRCCSSMFEVRGW
jgi:hypothetical protein